MGSAGTPSIDEILDIPGNRFAYERLEEILNTGEAIAFIGAGASAPLYPLWSGLIRELVDEALKRGRATEADKARWLDSSGQDPQGVVQDIRTQLGDRIYGEVLRQIFGYKQGEDGNSYTPAHAALMQMPFVGYVTTNYDPGLLEARDKLRPDVRATGYVVWTDNDPVYRWYTDAIFQEEKCPVLYAHGVYQRSDTIVLGKEGYERAYAPGPYRRLFENLWGRHQLVFVGFGFSDPWLDYIIHEDIEQLAARAAGEPRHVAILGLPEDETYTP